MSKYSISNVYDEANLFLSNIKELANESNINIEVKLESNNLKELDLNNFTGYDYTLNKYIELYNNSNKIISTYDLDNNESEEELNYYKGKVSFLLGVNNKGLSNELNSVINELTLIDDITVTSAVRLYINKGAKLRSLHLKGDAVDLRLTENLRNYLKSNSEKYKNLGYDVIDEKDHIHIEYQLKKKKAQYGYKNLYLTNGYPYIKQLESGSQYYLNLLSNKGLSSGNQFGNFLKSESKFTYDYNNNNQQNDNQFNFNENNDTLNNGIYGALDMITLGLGSATKAGQQVVSSVFNGAKSFLDIGDLLSAFNDTFSNILVIGGIFSGIEGVRDSIKQKRQEASADKIQEFGILSSLNQFLGNQEEEQFERQQRIKSNKRLVFYNFFNSGVNNNLIYYKYGGKSKKYKYEAKI